MNHEERVREILDGAQPLDGAATEEELAEDQLFAALMESRIGLEEADDAVLERLVLRHGTRVVAEAIGSLAPDSTAEAHAAPLRQSSLKSLAIPSPLERRSRGVPPGLTAAAVLAMTWFLIFRHRSGDSPGFVAMQSFPPYSGTSSTEPFATVAERTASLPPLDQGQPAFGSVVRDPLSGPGLRLTERLAVVYSESGFASGVVLGTRGWIVTASNVVEADVQNAAWQGRTAQVSVQLLQSGSVGVQPLGATLQARVRRHDRSLGLSLLQVIEAPNWMASPAGMPLAEIELGGNALLVGSSRSTVGQHRATQVVAFGSRLDLPLADPGIGLTRPPLPWPARGSGGTAASPLVRLSGSSFPRGFLGAPVFDADPAAIRLLGVALGGNSNEVWFAGPDSVAALLNLEAGSSSAAPVNPWAVVPGDTRVTSLLQASPGRPSHDVLRIEHRSGRELRDVSVFVADRPQSAVDPAPAEYDALGTFEWDAFMIIRSNGQIAVGTRGTPSAPARIWIGERELGRAKHLWTRGPAGWSHAPVDAPLDSVNWLSSDQRDRLVRAGEV